MTVVKTKKKKVGRRKKLRAGLSVRSWIKFLESSGGIAELGADVARELAAEARLELGRQSRRCCSAYWLECVRAAPGEVRQPCEELVMIDGHAACVWRPGMATVRRVKDLEWRDCPDYVSEFFADISWSEAALVPSVYVTESGYSGDFVIEQTELLRMRLSRELGDDEETRRVSVAGMGWG
jgi:hypothetical protein